MYESQEGKKGMVEQSHHLEHAAMQNVLLVAPNWFSCLVFLSLLSNLAVFLISVVLIRLVSDKLQFWALILMHANS